MNIMKKNLTWNMIGSLVNTSISLLFLIIVTRINGKNEAGIFTFAFSIGCFMQVIANYYGRTFQVTNIDKKISNSDFLYNRVTTSLIMLFVVFCYLLIKDYSLYKNVIILLFILFRLLESIADSLYAILQENEELYKVGISLFIKGIFYIIIFLIVDIITKNIILSIASIILVNLIVFIIYDIQNVKKLLKLEKFKLSVNNKLLKIGFFTFALTFLTQYILNAPKYTIDELMSNSDQTIFGIIIMPATVLILFSQLVIQPFLTKIKNLIYKKKFNELNKLNDKIIIFILLFGGVGLVLVYFIGIPFINFLYGLKLNKYLSSLLIIILGSVFFSISYIISAILIALRKTFIQMVFYIIASIFVFFVSHVLIKEYGIYGASLSYMVTMLFIVVMYIIYFKIIINIRRREVNEEK